MSEVSEIKVAVPQMACDVIDMAIQLHGGAGMSEDVPLAAAYANARSLRLADGPDEVHLGSQPGHEARDVVGHQGDRVGTRPVAGPVATQVHRVHHPVPGEGGGDDVPVAGRETGAGQQDRRRVRRLRAGPGAHVERDPRAVDLRAAGHGTSVRVSGA